VATPIARQPNWSMIAVFAGLQMVRIWVIATLGPYWTTRIITIDDAPLVRTGPFRFVRHPNYWVVVLEIATLPLAFGDWMIAMTWSVFNGLLLRHRITVEAQILENRRPNAALGS
jgi:methyltransferase